MIGLDWINLNVDSIDVRNNKIVVRGRTQRRHLGGGLGGRPPLPPRKKKKKKEKKKKKRKKREKERREL